MKKLIKRIKLYFKLRKIRRQSIEEAYDEYATRPNTLIRVTNEIKCTIYGHKWSSTFNPKEKMDNNTKARTYCTRCGVYYHEHKYND